MEKSFAWITSKSAGKLVFFPTRAKLMPAMLRIAADLSLPVTERLSEEVLSIPVRPNLTDEELETVIRAVREVATPVRAGAPAPGPAASGTPASGSPA